ncbi:MAG: site-2 protease family protein [Desulfatibacillum sp.]|nr:site-2 protease family protein [Desulfatibacillum sp.]
MQLDVIIQIAALVLAMAAHEAAHAGMAFGLGDPTAQRMGRLTLNPIKHIDPIGTILVPGVLLLTGSSFVFGWAKPVPVNYSNLKSRQDAMLVSLAGVVVNLALAMLAGFILQILWANGWVDRRGIVFLFLFWSVIINGVLGIFNLIPLPPLDGSHVVSLSLPPNLSARYTRMQPYAIVILVILMATGALWTVMDFFVRPVWRIALGDLAWMIQ